MDVVLEQSEPLVALGLMAALRQDPRLNVISDDLEALTSAHAVVGSVPRVMILDDPAARAGSPEMLPPRAGIVVLAREPTHPYGMFLLAAGLSCLATSATPEEILDAVHLTKRGGCIFVSGDGVRAERCDESKGPLLTKREIQVLHPLSMGRPYVEIARDLSISVSTVNKHVHSLLHKLKASSKRDLIGLPIQWLK